MAEETMHFDYDFIIVGSGFGGSVSAMRLSQKGYKVAVLESGKRWRPNDFPKTNWSLSKYLWMPKLGLYGIQRINLLDHFFLVSGSGVGGGSLVYANTLYVPGKSVFEGEAFRAMGGEKELLPFYDVATRMLGVTENTTIYESDNILKEIATEMGRGDTFRKTPVGVYFGKPGVTSKDPYFLGDGPDRTGCNFCGGCMVGCRFDAKNTLDKNYLYFAEKLGATIIPETKVVSLIPLDKNGKPDPEASGEFGYEIQTRSTTGWFGSPRRLLTAKSVILSAGVMGSLGLLWKMQSEKKLRRLSPKLGERVRTNSETVLGITNYKRDVDYSRGVAITSSIHPDEHTHIEPVRYPSGSDFFGLISSALVDGGKGVPRQLKFLFTVIAHPIYYLKSINPFGFAKKSIIILVMQTLDNSIKLVRRRRWIWPFSKSMSSIMSEGESVPSYIPIANQVARRVAEKIGGVPRSSTNDTVLNAPITGHIMGGCIMGKSAEKGVIDYQNKVFGYENLRVVDGSMIPVNLGVNPSLSITALSERAMSFIPPKEKEIQKFKFEEKFGISKIVFQASSRAKKTAKKKTLAKKKRRLAKAKG